MRFEQTDTSNMSELAILKVSFYIWMYMLCHSYYCVNKPHPLQYLARSLEQDCVSFAVNKRKHLRQSQLVISHNS